MSDDFPHTTLPIIKKKVLRLGVAGNYGLTGLKYVGEAGTISLPAGVSSGELVWVIPDGSDTKTCPETYYSDNSGSRDVTFCVK